MDSLDYKRLYHISRALHQQHLDLNLTLKTVLSMTGDAVEVLHGCLMTFTDPQTVEHSYILGSADSSGSYSLGLWDLLRQQGLVSHIYDSEQTVVISNIQSDPRWPELPQAPFRFISGSAIGLSISHQTTVYGVMLFVHPQVDYFMAKRVHFLEEVAKMASIAIDNARAMFLVRTAKTRYETLFEHTIVPIVLTDTLGEIVAVNYQASEFLGFSRADLIGVPLQDINIASVEDYGIDELAEDEETYFRTTLYDVDGDEIPTLVRARRLNLQGQAILEWMLQDIRAQMELEQLRKDLTAMIYHDLRGPLNNVNASVVMLRDILAKHPDPVVSKIIGLGLRSVEQLQRLVDSLLDIQRLEEHRAILNQQLSELHPLIEDVIQLVGAIAEEANQRIEVNAAGDLPHIEIDIDMITRVVTNLVENAIKYTPEGGTIGLSAEAHGEYVVIAVSDSGPGIPEEMRVRIFDKFSRVKYQDVPKGIGLGLAFCRLAVEAHGGNIWVDSNDGLGSAFKFTLPIYHENGIAAHSDKAGDAALASSAQ